MLATIGAHPSVAQGKEKTTILRVRDEAALTITGGYYVSAAGDVNGDGIPDFTVVHPDFNSTGMYVIFGDPGVERIDLPLIGVNGFAIIPRSPLDRAWFADGAGDVNGDGLDDIVVGAPQHGAGGSLAGRAYVVFGKSDPAPVPLALYDAGIQGPLGFRIDAAGPAGLLGQDVAGLGDVNGDGLSDVAVGAPFHGRTYVVFGKKDSDPVDLDAFEDDDGGGFRIMHFPSAWDFTYRVSAAGDVNGDGAADLTIGVYHVDEVQDEITTAHIVYGKKSRATVDTHKRRFPGVRVKSGASQIGGVGDVNGDGFDDVVGQLTRPIGDTWPGYILFGRKGKLSANPKENGVIFTSKFSYASGMGNVTSAGDFNGDGVDDFLTGHESGQEEAGILTIVFGQHKMKPFELSRLSTGQGIALAGDPGDRLGASLSGIGDFDGDGLDDILVSASGPREAYIVLGRR